jgi:hypothetical protein
MAVRHRYRALFKHIVGAGKQYDGWYYRVGSGPRYPWVGPFVTKHVATQVRDQVTGGAWGTRRADSRASRQ